MTRRRLSKEEKELWQKVVSNAQRLHKPAQDLDPISAPRPSKPAIRQPVDLAPFRVGQRQIVPNETRHVMQDISQQVGAAPLQMDKKTHKRLRQGQLKPEGRLDLHGMTLNQAHPALTRFILEGHAQGKRLLLVITGKGKSAEDVGPIPVRRGMLRHNVPGWLAAPPLSAVVAQVVQAHVRHGGGGAYYVYLRRRGGRKSDT